MFKHQIGKLGTKVYEEEKGKLFVLLMEAIKLREETEYQPPRPCDENYDEEKERQYQDDCEYVQKNLERVMKQMFLALTGKKVILVK